MTFVQWASTDSHVEHILDWAANSEASWGLFGSANFSGDTSCVPQPAGQNIQTGQPELEYWSIYETRLSQFRVRRLPMLVGLALFLRVGGRTPVLGEIAPR
jgi:hypothetical protein